MAKQSAERFAEGLASHQAGRLADAETAYRDILKTEPLHADALMLLSAISLQRGDGEEAVRLIDRALTIDPNQIMAHNNRGVALQALGRQGEALQSYDRALALGADFAEIHYNRAVALQILCWHHEALQSYDRALAQRADYPNAYNNRGNVLRDLKRHEEALQSFERALAVKPDFADAHVNRGNALRDLKRYDEALTSYDRALALKPDFSGAHYNRGVALQDMRRFDEALGAYARAIALQPDHADAHWNTGFIKLLTGDFAGGWPLHEWRWKRDGAPGRRSFSQPLWHGDGDLKDKTLLLYAEQGYGDSIHFSRYAALAAAHGAKVILEIQPALKELMQSLPGVTQIVAQGETLPGFDCHCPLLSLPHAFKTGWDNIPSNIPYLQAPADRVARWKDALGEQQKLRIGIAWAGNPDQLNDHNRSMTLADMLPLLAIDAEFFSLQKDMRAADRERLAATPVLRDLGTQFADFSDTAAVIELMDIIITVDTSVAHLAGALGKKLWVFVAHKACWRWLLDRDDNPWYPTARLFRQSSAGDWRGAVDAATRELKHLRDGKM
jgi:tetratricopeptide (TPR) repeat protein